METANNTPEMSTEEWQARVDLAAAYRLVALYGWDDLVFTHISARIPDTDQFLINPYGMMFDEITASSLVKVDFDGNKIGDSPYPVNPAGFTIHSCIHEARDDVHCVMHTHSINGVAVSAMESGVTPISQQAFYVLASLAYHEYEGVALNEDEKARIVADMGDKTFMMLRNHGLLTVGKTPAEAFLAMYIFEAACMVQVRAQAGGGKLIPIPDEILALADKQGSEVTLGLGGGLIWPAMLRKLDRVNPGYAD